MLTCPRRHYWRYEVGMRKEEGTLALRFGSAWHRAMEARARGLDPFAAMIGQAGEFDEFDEITLATLTGLLAGYANHYGPAEPMDIIPEVEFEVKLEGSRTFAAAGKLDGLVSRSSGVAILEHKTTGSAIDSGSDYWLRLRADTQILMYADAARKKGWSVSEVIYDVVRKPAIRQKEDETPDEYSARLTADCGERPEFYFARREVPVLDQDIEEFSETRKQVCRMILDRRRQQKPDTRHQAWPRNVSAMICPGCDYCGFCLANHVPAAAPAGYVIGEKHSELENQGEAA